MGNIISTFLQIIAFLVTNKESIKQIILNIEGLIPDAPGTSKAAAVKSAIATGMGIEAQIEAAWPLVSPIFNLFVAAVKPPKV